MLDVIPLCVLSNPTTKSTLVSTDRLTLVGVKKGPRNVPSVLASLEIHALGKVATLYNVMKAFIDLH